MNKLVAYMLLAMSVCSAGATVMRADISIVYGFVLGVMCAGFAATGAILLCDCEEEE
jgi:hypothetical protein